jgi:hypothetical protein
MFTNKICACLCLTPSMTKCVKPLRGSATLCAKSSRSTIRVFHLDDLTLNVARSLSGLTHFVTTKGVYPSVAFAPPAATASAQPPLVNAPSRPRPLLHQFTHGHEKIGSRRRGGHRRSVGHRLEPGAYTRPLFSSTSAVSGTKYTLNTP